MTPETVLITGASSGIGLELAHLFAADKCRLVLVARNVPKLEELARTFRSAHGVTVEVLPVDLSQRGATAALTKQLAERSLSVDILVNNAGFGARGHVADLSLSCQMEIVQVNIAALTELTRALLPGMIERKRGGILNVASTAAFQPGPNLAVYYASKAYVLSFSEALAEELRGTSVHCTCVCPGPTDSNFAAVAEMEDSVVFRMGAMSAVKVARASHRAFRRQKFICVPGFINWLASFSIRFAPRRAVLKIAKFLNS